MYWRRKAVTAKIETTYGTDAAPTGTAHAMVLSNLRIEPLKGERRERAIERPFMGAPPSRLVDQHVVLTADCEITTSGTAGTAPPWSPLARGAGLAEVVTADTDVRYRPADDPTDAVSIHLNIDGTLHRLLGARGDVTLRFQASQDPMFQFRFLGLFTAVAAASLPALTTTAWQDPAIVGKANTSFTIDGYAAALQLLELSLGNDLQGRFLVGQEAIRIVDRRGGGRVNFEAPPVGTKNFFTLASQSARVAIGLVHGTAAGSIVEVSAPGFELGEPAYEQVQGLAHLAIPGALTPDAGNDEIEIVVR